MIRRFIGRFHREESAQISFLAVASAICFIGLLSMVMNSNDIVTERIAMQDVADTVTVSAASWTARGLNMISMINVLNSKLISTAVLINATADAIPAIKVVGEIQEKIFNGCSAVPFVGPFCAAMAIVVRVQITALNVLDNIFDPMADNLSRCSSSKEGALWPVMGVLNTVAGGVKETFTAIGLAESVAMARAVGADFGIVVNGNMVSAADSNARDLLSLPVKEVEFPAFCPYVKNGGSGYKMAGYECGKGPFKLGKERINKFIMTPFFNLFANPIFKGMAAAHFAKIGCTNDPEDENTEIEVFFRNITECRQYGGQLEWVQTTSETRPTTEANLNVSHFTHWKPLKESNKKVGDSDIPGTGGIDDLDLGIDTNIGPTSGASAPLGSRYNLLIESTESNPFTSKFNCRSQQIPNYAASSFDGTDTGVLGCRIGGLNLPNCRRIDQWGEFTYYSGQGVPGGSSNDIGGYYIRVGKRVETEATENDPATYVYMVETVSLVSAGSRKMDQDEFKDYLKNNGDNENSGEAKEGSEKCTKPDPLVLDQGTTQADKENFQNKLRFVGVVYHKLDDGEEPFWSNYFDSPPNSVIAYAQAQVYNHLAEDTFTQDWRVRMEQTSLLEEVFSKRQELNTGGAFGTNQSFIGTINNH